MADWIKQVRKAGYIVDEHQLLYKIRDPQSGGLIMTAPMFPKGPFVVRNTQSMASKKGIVLAQEAPRVPAGQAPPPTFSDPPPEHVAMAEQIERERAERKRKEQEEAMAEKARHIGRPPATPEQIEETRTLGKRLDKMAGAMPGGKTDENLLSIWRVGRDIAQKAGTWFPGNRSNDPEYRALRHMNSLIGGEYTALNSNQAEFWRVALAENEHRSEAAGEVLVPPVTGIKELKDAHARELQDKNREIADLKLEVSKTGAHLERTQRMLDQMREQRDAANAQYKELDEEYAAFRKEREAAKSNGAVSDELSVAVLRRMLLVRFPDGEKEINDAIEFAVEVAKRT